MPAPVVCHFTSVHIPFDTRIFHKECTTLARAGYEVHLVARHDHDETRNGVRIHAVPPRTGKLRRMLGTVPDVYRAARAIDAAVYHFHDPELMPAALLLKLRGKRVIMDVHEDYPDYIRYKPYIPKPFRAFFAWATGLLERIIAPFMDAVIVVTPKIHERFGPMNCRTIRIHNYPMTNELASANTASSARTDTVAYIGNITRDRGIVEMVRAVGLAAASRPVRLILGGTFSPPELERDVRAMPEFAQVDYRGFLSRTDVAAVLGEVRAGLVVPQPFSYNRFGYMNKLFEYMAAGIPLIASDFPQWRELIGDTGAGLMVDPLDPEAIAGAIRDVLDNPEEAAAMGARGRAAVLAKFNWDTEAAVLLNLYRDLTGGPQPN